MTDSPSRNKNIPSAKLFIGPTLQQLFRIVEEELGKVDEEFYLETIYFLTQFVILNEVKNLNAFTLCIQILRDAQDDNWVLTDISFPFIFLLKRG